MFRQSESCHGKRFICVELERCFNKRHHGELKTVLHLQIRVLCLHLEKLNLLKIFLANFGLKMTYQYVFHVVMNILRL